jgi:sugar phosphate isomerase/epimerase
MDRRNFLTSVGAFTTALTAANFAPALARELAANMPANKNVKWALSSALWRNFPPGPFTDILDVMQATGFLGVRLTSFPSFMQRYDLTPDKLRAELDKRGLSVVTISWNGPLIDPARRKEALDDAKRTMTFLSHFGANHLVVFPPNRALPGANTPEAFKALCEACNQIGEIAGEMGFTAGLHNHMGQMVQTQDEVDRFMEMTDPKLFGLSPDTAHLHLAGCDVVGTFERYKSRIRFADYKDSKWTYPTKDLVMPSGKVLPKDSEEALFYNSIYDLGDGGVDFPGCHRVLKSENYKGWLCVDLDTSRLGPLADYKRCDDYIVETLQPIYL